MRVQDFPLRAALGSDGLTGSTDGSWHTFLYESSLRPFSQAGLAALPHENEVTRKGMEVSLQPEWDAVRIDWLNSWVGALVVFFMPRLKSPKTTVLICDVVKGRFGVSFNSAVQFPFSWAPESFLTAYWSAALPSDSSRLIRLILPWPFWWHSKELTWQAN